jgi:hypothetical protein
MKDVYFAEDLVPGMMFSSSLPVPTIWLVAGTKSTSEIAWNYFTQETYTDHYVDVTYVYDGRVETIRYFRGSSAWRGKDLLREPR